LYRLDLYQDAGEIDLGRVTRAAGFALLGSSVKPGGQRQFLGISLNEKSIDWNFPPDLGEQLERDSEPIETKPTNSKFGDRFFLRSFFAFCSDLSRSGSLGVEAGVSDLT
jgi:hypothetical protein